MPMIEIDDKELGELRKQANAGAKSTALAEALQDQLKTAKEAAARVPDLEAQIGQFRTAQVDQTFNGAGLTDAKVRRVFQLEFDEQAAAEGGEKELGKWLGGLQALEADKRPAHLAPFLTAPKAADGGAGAAGGTGAGVRPPTGGKLPDADRGANAVD